MQHRFFLTLLLLSPFSLLFSQAYEGHACTQFENPALHQVVDLMEAGVFLKIDLDEGENGAYQNWATSFLKPSGTAPPLPTDGMEYEEEEELLMNNHAWTCKYSAFNLIDGNPKTAWVEGVNGYGEGEMVLAAGIDPTEPVEIWAGYGKSESIHQKNSRPKKVRVMVLQSKYANVHQFGIMRSNLKVLAYTETTLKDLNGWQSLKTPDLSGLNMSNLPKHHLLIGIEILDVYPGEKWDDTCISEIRNSPK